VHNELFKTIWRPVLLVQQKRVLPLLSFSLMQERPGWLLMREQLRKRKRKMERVKRMKERRKTPSKLMPK